MLLFWEGYFIPWCRWMALNWKKYKEMLEKKLSVFACVTSKVTREIYNFITVCCLCWLQSNWFASLLVAYLLCKGVYFKHKTLHCKKLSFSFSCVFFSLSLSVYLFCRYPFEYMIHFSEPSQSRSIRCQVWSHTMFACLQINKILRAKSRNRISFCAR